MLVEGNPFRGRIHIASSFHEVTQEVNGIGHFYQSQHRLLAFVGKMEPVLQWAMAVLLNLGVNEDHFTRKEREMRGEREKRKGKEPTIAKDL